MTTRAESLGLRPTVAGVVALLLLVPFALLAVLVVGNWTPLHEWDGVVTDTLHRFAMGHPAWVRAMLVCSFVFSPTALRVVAVAVVMWLYRRGARGPALWVAITMVAGGVLDAVLKLLVGRHRPDLLDPVARAAGFSFPSGHALNSALAGGVFLLIFLPFVKDRPGWRIMLWAAAIVVPLVTGVSRIMLGVHWTSDVIAGWLLGAAVVAVTAAAFETWRERLGRRRTQVTDEGVEPEIVNEA
jgi:membrane-associated phospholipid phosphatase